ncbi:hypothetical protein BN2127_JRS9_00675 [Bacillus subtilis]|uniref:Imm26 family immunity protein n=1 Tax=Bacillus subtilis TaxID=1423 RepID=UPI0006A93BBB|nr:Imm26 family immunity protein [Bacillus subtilis]CUB14691.1 hypothetical protein BN2127_JRS2_01174 [Bacillus subtilis]CUB46651.1 hypothetical protein BN2127_JRS11_00088 [Bacillus subtilis]CUB53441.1 hypothetical protein BN2127_JRS9_00675 [Bacillus subtilis]
MGFWEEKYKNKKIFVSDDGLDICHDAIEDFHAVFLEQLDRKPTLNEFVYTLFQVLKSDGDSLFKELEGKQVTDINLKMKKRTTLSEVRPGVVIEIPLRQINQFTYALVVKGDLATDKNDDLLIQYFDIFTDQRLSKKDISLMMAEKQRTLFIANTGYTGFLQGNWKVVSKVPIDLMKKFDHSAITFVMYEDGKYLINQVDSLAAESDLIEVDEKRGKTFSNPIGLFGHLSIEDILYQYFKGTSMEELIKYEL